MIHGKLRGIGNRRGKNRGKTARTTILIYK